MEKNKRKKSSSPAAVPEEVILNWKLDKRGKLTVSCNGRMPDYSRGKNPPPPWHDRKDEIKTVCLQEGVTEVGGNAFEGCVKLKKVIIPWSLRRLHHDCFKNCVNLKLLETVNDAEYRFVGEGFSLKSRNQRAAIEMQTGKTQEIVFGLNSFYAVPWAIQKWGPFYVKKEILYTCFTNVAEAEIPDGVRSIQAFALMDAEITQLTLPKTLARLEPFALSNTKMKQILIPESVEYIGAFAFADSEINKVIFDARTASPESQLDMEPDTFTRSKIAFEPARSKRIPEAFKVDIAYTGQAFEDYKKLCVKEKPLKASLVIQPGQSKKEYQVIGTVSLNAQNSIFRRLQRGSAILKIRYDKSEKRVLAVSSWRQNDWECNHSKYVAEPYFGRDGQIELKSKGFWYFGTKESLKEDFSICSVLDEWDEGNQVRRLDETQCEEWFWSAGYSGTWGVPEKKLLEQWMQRHPEYSF